MDDATISKHDSEMVRITVRTVPAHGDMRRYRAGLGPFSREPVTIEVTPEQIAVIKTDPVLIIEGA